MKADESKRWTSAARIVVETAMGQVTDGADDPLSLLVALDECGFSDRAYEISRLMSQLGTWVMNGAELMPSGLSGQMWLEELAAVAARYAAAGVNSWQGSAVDRLAADDIAAPSPDDVRAAMTPGNSPDGGTPAVFRLRPDEPERRRNGRIARAVGVPVAAVRWVWETHCGAAVAGDGTRLFISTASRDIGGTHTYGVNPTDGSALWESGAGGTLLIDDDALVVDDVVAVHVLDPDDGTERWKGPISDDLVVQQGVALVKTGGLFAAERSTVTAYRLDSGERVVQRHGVGPSFHPIGIWGDRAWVVDAHDDGMLLGVDLAGGRDDVTVPLNHGASGPVFDGCMRGSGCTIDLASGERVSQASEATVGRLGDDLLWREYDWHGYTRLGLGDRNSPRWMATAVDTPGAANHGLAPCPFAVAGGLVWYRTRTDTRKGWYGTLHGVDSITGVARVTQRVLGDVRWPPASASDIIVIVADKPAGLDGYIVGLDATAFTDAARAADRG